MDLPLPSSSIDDVVVDPAQPFLGVVLCCTSIPPEQRSGIAEKAAELGGVHKYDLTPDVTHLIVGEYDTPKYRHVAKERPDIKAMSAGWVEAVRDLWTQDAPIDFRALEKKWRLKTFETDGGDASGVNIGRLLICLTGFDDAEERQNIMETIQSNGGAYTGDLTRKVTHLVVNRPEGRKYSAAKNWGTHTVSIEWIRDSVERGMILDEQRYDPLLPREERGVGAWKRRLERRVSLGKRGREGSTSVSGAAGAQDDRRKKLKRTASQKLGKEGLWGDILGNQPSQQTSAESEGVSGGTTDDGPSEAQAQAQIQIPQPQLNQEDPVPGARPLSGGSVAPPDAASSLGRDRRELSKPASFSMAAERPVFHSCHFCLHGFSRRQDEVLANTILSLGGQLGPTLDDLSSALATGATPARRILVVPQESQSVTHPRVADDVDVVTEFYIEKCLHKKQFFEPRGHVIGRPFPACPVRGFEQLAICTSGFTGVDLNQVDKAVRQLGARYDERFSAQTSVLLVTSLVDVRKRKLDLALVWKVPIVRAEWLWECIATGFKAPFRPFMFLELNQSLTPPKTQAPVGSAFGKGKQPMSLGAGSLPPPAPKTVAAVDDWDSQKSSNGRRSIGPIDTTAFDTESLVVDEPPPTAPPPHMQQEESVETAVYETAPTHPAGGGDSNIATNTTGTTATTTTTTSATGSRNPSVPLSEVSSNARKSPSPQKQDRASHPLSSKKPITRKGLGRIPSEVADSEAADSSDGHERDDDAELEQDAEELKRKLLAQRKQSAADRLALSTKLTSLLDTPGSVEHNILTGAAAARPRRRRRQIMGRAVSNVSVGSNASAPETGATVVSGGAGAGERAESGPAALAAALGGSVGPLDELDANGGASSRPPPATQLEYEDPNARIYKAQLLAGASGPGADAARLVLDDDGSAGRLTFRDLQQPHLAGGRSGLAGYGGHSRRTRKH